MCDECPCGTGLSFEMTSPSRPTLSQFGSFKICRTTFLYCQKIRRSLETFKFKKRASRVLFRWRKSPKPCARFIPRFVSFFSLSFFFSSRVQLSKHERCFFPLLSLTKQAFICKQHTILLKQQSCDGQ